VQRGQLQLCADEQDLLIRLRERHVQAGPLRWGDVHHAAYGGL
jgi:hypothetical protein